MSKVLKSVTLGNVKNGGIFKALGKEFVKLDADEHGCLAEQVWLVIRHALAWHDKPEGDWMNVEFDKPLNRSDQPQPTIKLTEVQDNTKPACDG